jgi:hypothetical protein
MSDESSDEIRREVEWKVEDLVRRWNNPDALRERLAELTTRDAA